jgi:hypothetical protein
VNTEGHKGATVSLNWPRIWLAFLLPAVVAGFVGSLILSFTILSDMVSTGTEGEAEVFRIDRTGIVLFGTLLGAMWGQLATAFIGLPAHVWLMHYTRRRAWMYAVAGALAGTGFGATFVWATMFGLTFPAFAEVIWLALAGAAAGACAGLTFWLIRRPDLDARPVLPANSPHDQKA